MNETNGNGTLRQRDAQKQESCQHHNRDIDHIAYHYILRKGEVQSMFFF